MLEQLFVLAAISILVPTISNLLINYYKTFKKIETKLMVISEFSQVMSYIEILAKKADLIRITENNKLMIEGEKRIQLGIENKKIKLFYGKAVRYLDSKTFNCESLLIDEIKKNHFELTWFCKDLKVKQILP